MEKHLDPNAKEGMRIRLIRMEDDWAVDPQMEGTIRRIDDMGTLHVNWDDGRTLGVIPGVDEYQLLPPEDEQVGIEVFGEGDGPITTKYNQEFKRVSNTTKPNVKLETKKDKVKGGKADKLTVQDIAKKHKVPIGDVRKEIKMGVKIELEHTDDKELAREIAMDHVTEFPDFYSNPKYGAIASEKNLEKVNENVSDNFKSDLDRILSTIKTATFRHKEVVDKMIDNFYKKYNGKTDDSEKFNELCIKLKKKFEDKFNVDETTAAAGGGSTGAFVGPLKTKKNESKIIKKGDFINEISRINKLRNDGSYDGTSWVSDRDKDGWLLDDVPAWEGGKIVDLLAKLDINWVDSNLTVDTIRETIKKRNSDLITESKVRNIVTKLVGNQEKLKQELKSKLDIDEKDSFEDIERKLGKITKGKKNPSNLTRIFKAIGGLVGSLLLLVGAYTGIKGNTFLGLVAAGILLLFQDKFEIWVDKWIFGEKESEDSDKYELEETTTFTSALGDSGTYVTPAFAAPKGKHGPSKKPIWKGGTIVQNVKNDGVLVNEINKIKWVKDGKYVKLKEKCTKFDNQPWCNSGNDSDPLQLSSTTIENIDNISEKYNISKEYILEKIKTKINR